MSVTKKSGVSLMAVVLVVVLALGALFAVPVAAQNNNGLAGCDASTQALVWAAEDAYGYDWQAMQAAGFPNGAGNMGMGGNNNQGNNDGGDDMDMDMDMTPEATQGAKLDNTAKRPSVVSQDATQEPGDNAGAQATQEANAGNNNAGGQGAGNLNCQQLQADVLAFVFAQNGMQMGGRGQQQMMFNVGNDQFVGEFFVQLSGPQEVPGPGDADGIGEGWLSLDNENNQLCWAITLSGIDFPATAAHVHIGEVGEAGPPVIPMTPPADGNWAGCVDAEAQVIADIEANPPGFYVNVHTAPFPQGAVRGNLQGGGQQGQGQGNN